MKLYDTNALMALINLPDEPFAIADVSLYELKKIKDERKYSDEAKYKARRALKLLYNNPDAYSTIENENWNLDCDITIIESAKNGKYDLVTNDLSCAVYARDVYGIDAEILTEEVNSYSGYLVNGSHEDLIENQYYIDLDDTEERGGIVLDTGVLRNGELISLKNYRPEFTSMVMGSIKPLDPTQLLAYDSIENNKITMLKGPAGTGKTLIAVAYAMQELQRGHISKIYFFTNALPAKDTYDIGALPGTKDEKLMDSSVGNMLGTKFGSKDLVYSMIDRETLEILPLNYIRGMSIPEGSLLIFDEAQNTSIPLMKLALQRVEEGCKVIIAGDIQTQVDKVNFEGTQNGMRRASEVLRGHSLYGEVELNTIHRSELAELAELM